MKAIKIAIVTIALIFGGYQVQSVQAGAWDEIKKTAKKLGQGVKKDTKQAGKTAKKAGKTTKKESKKAVKDSKKAYKDTKKALKKEFE